jgi:single-stranded DNA-binding protein
MNANDLNSVTITGHIGRNPELKPTSKGGAYLRFSIAHNSTNEFGIGQTNWFNVRVWDASLARAFATRLAKGDHVTIVGRVEVSRVESDLSETVNYFNITAEDVHKSSGTSGYKNVNRVVIAGRLGRDAEFKLVGKTQDRPMLTFSLANRYADDANFVERTSWVNIAAWGALASEYRTVKLTKGQHLTVTGKLESRTVGEGEERRTFYTVVAERIAVNDTSNLKRHSGGGNGATGFTHYSQYTANAEVRFNQTLLDSEPDFGERVK